MNDRSPEMLKSTLIAGVVCGGIGGMPLVILLNCMCCSLIVGCGFFASYLYSRDCRRVGAEFRPGAGATVGLVAGAFYSLTTTLVIAAQLALFPPNWEEAVEQSRQLPWSSPESIETVRRFFESTGPFLLMLLVFFGFMIVSAIASTVGGLIGGAVFKVAALPPAIDRDPETPPSAPAL